MYVILQHVYKIGNTLNENPVFYALFSISNNKNYVETFSAESAEALAKEIQKHIDSLKMSRQHIEATFDNIRKYSNRGGTIKYQTPFTPSEEKVFLSYLMGE